MDGLQQYAGPNRPIVAHVHAPSASPSATKAPSDYIRAVRKRIWLVLALAIPVATLGTLYVLRMPAIYSTFALIQIKPPKMDASVARLVGQGEAAQGDPIADEKYAPNVVAMLSSKALLDQVVYDKVLNLPPSAFDNKDPALEIISKLKAVPVPATHFYRVTLEGRDPDLIARTLNLLLVKFRDRTERDSMNVFESAQEKASSTINTYVAELTKLEEKLARQVLSSKSLAPGGQNLKAAEYELQRQRYYHLQNEAVQARNQLALSAAGGPAASSPAAQAIAQQLADLELEKKKVNKRLLKTRPIRDGLDPSITHARAELEDIESEIARLKASASGGAQGPTQQEVQQSVLDGIDKDLTDTQGNLKNLLGEMKEEMPNYQAYTSTMTDRDLKAKQLAELNQKKSAFDILASTQKPPVDIFDRAVEPVVPVRPNRLILIAGSIVVGLGLGLALVCFLEHIDHSVKVPEHLTSGLTLPLFGVVPRMRRNALNNRGGHLWTPGLPDSVEADAYRNLRASLLGATKQAGPIVTLLVTSAKAGEGKSTTALNLAATCARAGERTLLMDVDLRRPSLNDVFTGHNDGVGLVDVLRGEIPWQRTVVQTDLPNLDFLPTGDPRDVPIEVLGSLELRQLLISLSEHHYDRVILDGPAVLGLADCRMLGRIVDAAVMVVRSGSQEIRSLQRAKAMLEQSQVTIAGLIFNGIADDLENWSSYGPNTQLDAPSGPSSGRDARRLDDRGPRAAAALMAAEAVEA